MSTSLRGSVGDKDSDGGPSRSLFDVRLMIAGLLGIYGIVLIVMGIGASDQSLAKADGIRINLWVGIGMAVVAAAFFVWARLRPLERELESAEGDGDERTGMS